MTLPSSGALSMSAINAEFGRGNNLNSYRGTVWYTDAGGSGTFSSGALSFSAFYGKRLTSPTFSFTISSSQANADLRTLAVNAGWNQSSQLIATIASGVTIYSNSTGSAALTVSGSFPGGVQLVNNGTILGRGGNGGNGAAANNGSGLSGGASGGLALSVSTAVSINNAGRIAGGGGGGGGGQRGFFNPGGKSGTISGAGGGGGGGIGNGPGGAAGSNVGGSGTPQAGGSGTLSANGSGGAGGSYAGAGGAGGSWGASGATGGSGNNFGAGAAGGAAGAAVAGNANITWIATGTRNGGIS